jgi:cell wall-associated NlpC family hydrolase
VSLPAWPGDAADREVAVPVATVWSGPDAPRDVDAPAVADAPDLAAWTSGLDATGRLGLVGRTLTQGLLGEPVQVRSERGGWVEVRLPWQESSQDPAGYPGWMRGSHLAEPARHRCAAAASVVSRFARVRVDQGPGEQVSFGTVLCRDDDADEVAVRLPGGRRGRVPVDAVRASDPTQPPAPTAELVLATARAFLGLRYLWGGTSAWGLDCSGLVHLTLRGLGALVPRDAHDQAAHPGVRSVDPAAVRPGDLWFFGRDDGRVTHVGFVSDRTSPDGAPLMLHAPERDGGGLLEEAPMDARRRASLLGAGRLELSR